MHNRVKRDESYAEFLWALTFLIIHDDNMHNDADMIHVPLIGVQARTGGFTNGASSQQIWLDNVQCTGRENRLIDCRANPLGTHNCNHGEDAGVRCPAERE